VYAQRKSMGALSDPSREVAECLRLARRAIELGRDDPVALCSAGSALAFGVGDLDLAATVIDRTLRLDPNMAWAWLSSSLVKTWLGEAEIAIEHAARAMRLSPYDTQFFVMQIATSMAHFVAGRYAEAQSWAERSGLTHPDYVPAVAMVAAAAALEGDAAAAREAMERLRHLVPALRNSNLRELLFPFRRTDDFDRLSKALRMAGLPE